MSSSNILLSATEDIRRFSFIIELIQIKPTFSRRFDSSSTFISHFGAGYRRASVACVSSVTVNYAGPGDWKYFSMMTI